MNERAPLVVLLGTAFAALFRDQDICVGEYTSSSSIAHNNLSIGIHPQVSTQLEREMISSQVSWKQGHEKYA